MWKKKGELGDTWIKHTLKPPTNRGTTGIFWPFIIMIVGIDAGNIKEQKGGGACCL